MSHGKRTLMRDYNYRHWQSNWGENPYLSFPMGTSTKKGGKVVRYINKKGSGFKRVESKFYDVTPTPFSLSTSCQFPNAGTILDIVQGTGESERVGRAIKVSSIVVRGILSLPSSTAQANTSDVLRFILYEDKQCNGAAATGLDLLETNTFLGHANLSKSHRFKFLISKEIPINAQVALDTSANSSGVIEYPFKFYYKCNCPIEYTGVTASIANIASKNLGIAVIGSNGKATISLSTRVRYVD